MMSSSLRALPIEDKTRISNLLREYCTLRTDNEAQKSLVEEKTELCEQLTRKLQTAKEQAESDAKLAAQKLDDASQRISELEAQLAKADMASQQQLQAAAANADNQVLAVREECIRRINEINAQNQQLRSTCDRLSEQLKDSYNRATTLELENKELAERLEGYMERPRRRGHPSRIPRPLGKGDKAQSVADDRSDEDAETPPRLRHLRQRQIVDIMRNRGRFGSDDSASVSSDSEKSTSESESDYSDEEHGSSRGREEARPTVRIPSPQRELPLPESGSRVEGTQTAQHRGPWAASEASALDDFDAKVLAMLNGR
ncbi:Chromosome partition protein Smc [Carpediemonas membranifera]|uniref:Chromosome partition protein Smc n=1 Tax=Carpediemonas membranifera TaxID=201153 RepID=A0A8J6E2C5_9EUKA|nr:Chromosome partition protein Smc [Carpediemonas membranifera]|eukprot:KAG9394523.1 Chromosome partition protein Smc [Carpediemonas membranifera]